MFGSLLNGGTISAGDGAYAIKAAALKGSSGDSDVGYSSLGIRAAASCMLADGTTLTPRVSVAWQHLRRPDAGCDARLRRYSRFKVHRHRRAACTRCCPDTR